MNITTFDSFSGENSPSVPYKEPVGEEKRVAAGLSALGGRAPDHIAAFVFPPNVVRGAPAGYHDYDVVVPVIFVSFGGSFSGRQVALLGHATFHVTGSGALDGQPLYLEGEEWVCDPLLLVKGSDGAWHAYRGQIVRSDLARMVESELARRTIAARWEQDTYDDPPHLGVGFDSIANAIVGINGDSWAAWAAWREIAGKFLSTEPAVTE